jgi:hypothetical protein
MQSHVASFLIAVLYVTTNKLGNLGMASQLRRVCKKLTSAFCEQHEVL